MLETILCEKNLCKMNTGEETGRTIKNGISIYHGEYGSTRYVLRKKGEIICAMLTTAIHGKTYAAMLYTKTNHRRNGHATRLFKFAAKRAEITQTEFTTEEGDLFLKSL